MRTDNSWRRQAQSMLLACGCLAAFAANATDSYIPSNKQLTIPALTIGAAIYSNVVLTVGSIVSGPSGTAPNANIDFYDPVSGHLSVAAVTLGSTTYYNVVVTVQSLGSIESVAGADTYNGSQLVIPSVLVGSRVYTNVVVTVGNLGVVAGQMPRATQDSYNASSAQLSIPAVQANGHVYTNVSITVGKVLSAVTTVIGISATSTPFASAVVTLKDAAGHSATATTAADGSFWVGTAGMTAPFLLSAAQGGTTLYSVALGNGVANLNAYTTAELQAYYHAFGTTLGAVFAGTPGIASFPSGAQLALVKQPFLTALQLYLSNAGVAQPQAFDPFSTPFTTNHAGFDKVLDRTVLSSGASQITVDNGSGTSAGPLSSVLTGQITPGNSTTLAIAAINTVTSNTTTGGSSSSQQQVPVGINAQQQTALAAAQAGVLQLFANIAQLVASKGPSISAADFAPYVDVNFLDRGVNKGGWEAKLVGNFGSLPAGTTLSASIVRVNKFNLANQTLDVTVKLTLTNGSMVQTGYLDENDNPAYGNVYKQETGGGWAFYGQQTLFHTGLSLNGRLSYDANSGTPNTPNQSLIMQAQVSTAPGALTSANVSGPANSLPDCTQNPPTFSLLSVSLAPNTGLDQYGLACNNSISGTPPTAGTVYTFALTEAGSGTVVHQPYPMDAVTLDFGDITQFNGQTRVTFAAANTVATLAGTTVTIRFTTPTTFPVLYSFVGISCQNASQLGGGGTDLNGGNNIPAGVFSASIDVPAQCSGAPMVRLAFGIFSVGINGEQAQVQQQIHN